MILVQFEERQSMIKFSDPQPCPIWDELNEHQLGPVLVSPQPCESPRAGGWFLLERSGALLLKTRPPTIREKINLSYWICHHNLKYRLYDPSYRRWENLPVLNEAWVAYQRDRMPSDEDRMLTFLHELILCADIGARPDGRLLMAAGGCHHNGDLMKLWQEAEAQDWLEVARNQYGQAFSYAPKPTARIHVKSKLDELGQSQQGFVAI